MKYFYIITVLAFFLVLSGCQWTQNEHTSSGDSKLDFKVPEFSFIP